MRFDVIPALDLWDGRLARMGPDGGIPIDSYGGDPLAAADDLVQQGARWLHVVDMDLAFRGRPANEPILSMLAVMDARIQASGGIDSADRIGSAMRAGAERVVLGSAALVDRSAVQDILARFGEAIVVAIEAEGDRIRPRGAPDVRLPLEETLRWLAGIGAPRFLYVAVERVGSLSGPDLDGIARTALVTQRPVIASGGISSVDDVRAVAELGPFVQGVILGRALLEGALTVRQATSAAIAARG